jgi:nitroreductase
MNILETLINRRSIRKYKEKTVPREMILQIIKAGMYAPSARNQQPWQFIIIDQKETMKSIMQVHPYASMLNSASHAIIICGDQSKEISKGYWPVDCSAATQNILIAAHGTGLGAVWLGVYPRDDRMQGIINIMKLPKHIIPFALVPVGYPDEVKQTPDRFDENRIHINQY